MQKIKMTLDKSIRNSGILMGEINKVGIYRCIEDPSTILLVVQNNYSKVRKYRIGSYEHIIYVDQVEDQQLYEKEFGNETYVPWDKPIRLSVVEVINEDD